MSTSPISPDTRSSAGIDRGLVARAASATPERKDAR